MRPSALASLLELPDVRARTPSGRWRLTSVAIVGFATADRAHADQASPEPANGFATAQLDAPSDHEREIGLAPLLGGDTDHGFGGGALGSVAIFDRDQTLYRWKVEFGAFYAVKSSFTNPSFLDAFALITFPQLLRTRLRLELRPSFTKDTALGYYGIGNRPAQPEKADLARDTYERLHPSLAVTTLWRGRHDLSLLIGGRYTYNRIAFDPASTLAQDMMKVSHDLEAPHSVVTIETGLVYDSRDDELSPTSGQDHAVKLRVSPQLGSELPYGYQQVNATVRVYHTIVPRYLVLAVRAVFDVQLGDVPFYEMSRFEDTSAIGGSQGVRGVPAYHFYGRVKAFGNVELRSQVTRFKWLGSKFILGFAGFFDAGRLWSDVEKSRPDLDGTGLGLHYGAGGGIRLQKGRSFLLRADVAWSPDAQPIGVYVLANHPF